MYRLQCFLFHFLSQETDVPLELYTTSCKRVCPEEFHSVGKERALAEVASLYEYVQKLPDGPQKTHFLKRVSGDLKLWILQCYCGRWEK